jgi:hypothetical protein
MKTILSLILAAVLSLQVQAGDPFEKLYSKYAENEDITSINLTETMLRIASKFLDEEDVEAREVINSIESIKILVSEHKKVDGFFDDALAVINGGNYEDIIRVNDADDKVRIAVDESGDRIRDIVILVESEDELVFMNITGDIDVNQVGKALRTLDIEVDGLDLEELENHGAD